VITRRLTQEAPQELCGQRLLEVQTLDGVKYLFADDSWLLVRPSGTESVLRVYAEGRSEGIVKELLDFGHKFAQTIV
jgi:phosphomannomutase